MEAEKTIQWQNEVSYSERKRSLKYRGLDDEYKICSLEDENIIAIRQIIVSSLKICDGFQKAV
jgi:hypothetical protein